MPPVDVEDPIAAGIADRHRELELVAADVVGVKVRLRSQDIVKRRQPISAARREEDAEILRMAVGRSDQPEQDLCLEERELVRLRIVAAQQELGDRGDTGAAFILIFVGGSDGKGLVAVGRPWSSADQSG